MGPKNFWTDALGLFTKRGDQDATVLKGKRIAVDVSILLNKRKGKEETQYTATSEPLYPSREILKHVEEVHSNITKAGIKPVYIFDGAAPRIKKQGKDKRLGNWENHKRKYDQAIANFRETNIISDADLEEALLERRRMAHPTVLDHANVIHWMKDNGIECYGAAAEADYQAIKMEMDGFVNGVMTEDGDLIVLGGQLVLAKMSRKGGLKFCVFRREELLSPENPYHSISSMESFESL